MLVAFPIVGGRLEGHEMRISSPLFGPLSTRGALTNTKPMIPPRFNGILQPEGMNVLLNGLQPAQAARSYCGVCWAIQV
jgi:hypothetical protein